MDYIIESFMSWLQFNLPCKLMKQLEIWREPRNILSESIMRWWLYTLYHVSEFAPVKLNNLVLADDHYSMISAMHISMAN